MAGSSTCGRWLFRLFEGFCDPWRSLGDSNPCFRRERAIWRRPDNFAGRMVKLTSTGHRGMGVPVCAENLARSDLMTESLNVDGDARADPSRVCRPCRRTGRAVFAPSAYISRAHRSLDKDAPISHLVQRTGRIVSRRPIHGRNMPESELLAQAAQPHAPKPVSVAIRWRYAGGG
jgi:hypothetical protein